MMILKQVLKFTTAYTLDICKKIKLQVVLFQNHILYEYLCSILESSSKIGNTSHLFNPINF